MLRYLVACLALLLPIAGAAVAIDPRIGHSNSAVHEANLATTEEAHARVEASRIAADERRAAALDTEAKEVSHQDSKKKHLEYKKFSNKKKHNLHKVRMTNAINDIVEHLDLTHRAVATVDLKTRCIALRLGINIALAFLK